MRHVARAGKINLLWTLVFGAGAAVVGLALLLGLGGPGKSDGATRLKVHCAAGLRFPVEEIARAYEDEFGVRIELAFGGSNTLLNQIVINKFDDADLYLAADDFYTDQAHAQGLAAERIPIAHQRPVVAVRKDSPHKIQSFQDLLADGVSVAVANPDQAAIGRATKQALESASVGQTSLWTQLERHVTDLGVFKPTVSEVANDVLIGSVDAGIVWDATVAMPAYRDQLKAIPLAALDDEPNLVTLSVLNSSRHPTAALRFARYLAARDRGLPVFGAHGLRPVEGDVWAERPELTFFCGAVNRRAMEQIIEDFQRREGVVINTVYDGCGILTSRMQTFAGQKPENGFPDVYMACDVYYLENVKDWFQEAANVSDTELVIAVPKGSTRVQSLADLVKPGVRVAVGQPDQCTIGALTRRLLTREGLYEKLKEKQRQADEVVVEKSSSALLIPDVVTGAVDAVVAYITDVLANQDEVDVIRVQSPLNKAIQPISIAKTSEHKYLVRRLMRKVAASPAAFESVGFHFRMADDPPAEVAPAAP